MQMHSLSRYYAIHLEKETFSLLDYGKTFEYSEVYLGKNEDDLVTLEPYMEDEFVKYINNDEHICEKGSEVADRDVRYEEFSVSVYQKNYTDIIGIPAF